MQPELVYEEVEFIDDEEFTAVRGVAYVKGDPKNRKMVAVNCSSEWQIKKPNLGGLVKDGCYLEILKTIEPEIIAAFGVH